VVTVRVSQDELARHLDKLVERDAVVREFSGRSEERLVTQELGTFCSIGWEET
jgi:hypothetical protein